MKQFPMKKVAVAVLAATAGMAGTQMAFAAVSAVTTAGLTENFQAPVVSGVFNPSISANTRFSITRDGTGANSDGMELVIFNYGPTGNYIGATRGDGTDYTANKATLGVTGTAIPAGGTQAIFVLMFRGNEAADTNASDDTLDGVAANKMAILLVPTSTTAGRTQFTATGIDISGGTFLGGTYTTASGATPTQLDTLGVSAGLNIPANRVAVGNTYLGPTLIGAAKNALAPGQVRLTFNAGLQDIADGTDVSTTVQAKVGANIKGTPTTQDGLGQNNTFNMAAGSTKFYFDNAGAAFGDPIDSVTVQSAGTIVRDEAGNSALLATQSVSIYGPPAYASSGQKIIVINNGAIGGDPDFYSEGGIQAGGVTLTLAARMAEDNGGSFNAADDVAVGPAGAFVGNTSAGHTINAERLQFTVNTVANGWYRLDPTSGKLQFAGTAGLPGTWADVTAAIAVGATAVTTIEGQALATGLAAQNPVAGVAADIEVSTADADKDGFIDGVSANYNAPVDTLGANHGFALDTTGGTTPTLGATFTNSGANANIVTGILTTPDTADWDGNGTGGETADSDIYTQANFNTGVTTTAKYTFGSTSGTGSAQYKFIFDVGNSGANLKIASRAQGNGDFQDGAAPVVLSATFNPLQGSSPAAGNVVITTSEPLTDLGTTIAADSNYYLFADSPLSLLNLDSGLGAATGGGLSTTTTANDTLTISNADARVGNRILKIGSLPGYGDAANNALVTDGTQTVTVGTAVFNGPKIVQAVGFRKNNAVAGNIDSVLVKFDKGVKVASKGDAQGSVATFAANGALEDGMFVVRVSTFGNPDVDVPIPAANVDLASAATGYVSLAIPDPGIVGVLTGLELEYNDGTTSINNKIVSTDAVQTTITDETGVNQFNGTDDDSRGVSTPRNTTTLYSQEIQGAITTNGSTAAARGTIVRADLVIYASEVVLNLDGEITVPCSCTSGSSTVAITNINNGFVQGLIVQARRDTARGFPVRGVRVGVLIEQTNQANQTGAGQPPAQGGVEVTLVPLSTNPGFNQKLIPATIDVTNLSITGTGIRGQLSDSRAVGSVTSLAVVDTSYQVLATDGQFRLNVGADQNFSSATNPGFIMVSVKQPDDLYWKLVTSPVQSFANHLPWAATINGAGTISQIGSVDLSKIAEIDVETLDTDRNEQGFADDVWQILDVKGDVAITTDSRRRSVPVTMSELHISIDRDGFPVTAWRDDQGPGDVAFTLQGNTVSAAAQMQSGNVVADLDRISALRGGAAIARFDPDSGNTLTPACIDNFGQPEEGLDDNCGGATPLNANPGLAFKGLSYKIFVPIVNATSSAVNMPAGWAWVTMNSDKAANAVSANVDVIIEAGSGAQNKTWFSGATANTLDAVVGGKSYLMHFKSNTNGFAF